MPLAANREISRYVDQELRTFKVLGDTHIFKGALVGRDRTSGYVRALEAGDAFVGIAYEESDNTGGADGARSVRVYTQGDFLLEVGGATVALIGRPVFAASDDTLSLSNSGGLTLVGRIIGVPSVGEAIVRIDPLADPQIVRAEHVPLASSTSAATTNVIMLTHKPILVLSAEVIFHTKPDQGTLDVGTDNSDPDEIVDAFNLASLTNHQRAVLTLAGNLVGKDQRLWARVGQASSTAGVGGLLTLRYIELP